jgi:multimeric flavodoxin WrbA
MMSSRNLNKTINYLKSKKKILFITTSNRWVDSQEIPKSSQLANYIAEKVGMNKVTIIDSTKLKIYPCEGNVSSVTGNGCGVKESVLKDEKKDPTGYHRCWATINNPDDELWKISKNLFESDCVIFFASSRWGQTNAYYQKLIERLTWIENRHSNLGEDNIVKDIDAGFITIGHNWRAKEITEIQKEVMKYYGFKTPHELFWGYQYTMDSKDETSESYKKTITAFEKLYGFILNKTAIHEIKLSIKKLLKF